MELGIERNELLSGLAKIQTVVERKSTMPIISNVLLEAEGDRVRLLGTDLEVAIETEHPAEVLEGGAITVSARKFYEMIREMPDSQVLLKEREGGRLSVLAGKIIYNLVGLPAEQFPSLPAYEDVKTIEIEAISLKKLINKTIFSVSAEDTRFNLSGIHVEKVEGNENREEKIRTVSSDGHRLSLMESVVPGIDGLDLESGVILPRKGAREILKLCENNEKLLLGFNGEICLAKAGTTTMIARLIDGEFPDYREIIPSGGKKKITVERHVFLDVLRRTAILSTEKYKAVSFNLSEGKIEVISVNPDIGDAKEEMEVEYDGDFLSINFNMHYLIEAIEVMESERLSLEMENESSPCLIKGEQDIGFLAIVMPMKV